MIKDEALKLALEALSKSDDFLFDWHENESDNEADAYATARHLNEKAITALREALVEPDYRAMYLKVRDELAALQQSRTPLTSKEIRAIEVDVATNLSLDYPSPAEQFTRAIEARHGIK